MEIKLPYSSDNVLSLHKSTIADVADVPVLTSPAGDGTAISLSFEPCRGRAVCWGIKAAVPSVAFSVILKPSILVRLWEIEPTPSLIQFCNQTLRSSVFSSSLCACSMVSLIGHYKKSWHKWILFICSSVLFADPTDEEENLVSGIVTIVVTDDDKIAAVHKPGNVWL